MRVVIGLLFLLSACKQPESAHPVAKVDPVRSKQLIEQYGCTTCHEVPGIGGMKGMGPSLAGMRTRPTFANKLPNSAANISAYIQNPQALDTAATMPNLGVPAADADTITAYLLQ